MRKKARNLLIAFVLAVSVVSGGLATTQVMAGGNGSSNSHCNGC